MIDHNQSFGPTAKPKTYQVMDVYKAELHRIRSDIF